MALFPSSMEATDKNCSYRMPFDQAVLPLRGCDPPSPKEDTNATYPPVNLQHNLKNWWFPVEQIIQVLCSTWMQMVGFLYLYVYMFTGGDAASKR